MVSVLNIMGALYSATIFVGVSNLMMVMSVIYDERVVYYREKSAGMYSPLPYSVAQVGWWLAVVVLLSRWLCRALPCYADALGDYRRHVLTVAILHSIGEAQMGP